MSAHETQYGQKMFRDNMISALKEADAAAGPDVCGAPLVVSIDDAAPIECRCTLAPHDDACHAIGDLMWAGPCPPADWGGESEREERAIYLAAVEMVGKGAGR